jgi:hypothetical protein
LHGKQQRAAGPKIALVPPDLDLDTVEQAAAPWPSGQDADPEQWAIARPRTSVAGPFETRRVAEEIRPYVRARCLRALWSSRRLDRLAEREW